MNNLLRAYMLDKWIKNKETDTYTCEKYPNCKIVKEYDINYTGSGRGKRVIKYAIYTKTRVINCATLKEAKEEAYHLYL